MRRAVLASEALLMASLSLCVCAGEVATESLPPIVLRMDGVSVATRGMPSTASSTAKTGQELFWLSVTALLTFGAPLLAVPDVLERGDAYARPARLCMESWKTVLEGTQRWLKSGDFQEFVLQSLRGETSRLVAIEARPIAVEVASGGSTDAQRKAIVREIGDRLSARVVLLADVHIDVEPLSYGCSALFRITASLQAVSAAMTNGDVVNFTKVSEWAPVNVHAWAKDPEEGRDAMRLILPKLADQIVQSYPWPRSDQDLHLLPRTRSTDCVTGSGNVL